MGSSRGTEAVATSIAFVAIAGAAVAIRVFVRLYLVSNWGADDALVVCSVSMSIALTILIKLRMSWFPVAGAYGYLHTSEEDNGLGQHFASLAPGEYTKMLKPFYISVIVYNLGLTLVKLSILCQFLRFFTDSRSRKICICMLCLIAAYGAAMQFGSIFACTPVSYFWNRTIANGHCIDLLAFWFSNASFNIVTDLMICVLPVPVLKGLQLPRKQKYGLIAVFIVGGFGCITSILRLHSLYIISRSTDITWDNVGAATWSSVELNVGIVCACLPSLRPIIGLIWPRFNRSTQSRSRSNGGDIIVRSSTYVRHSVGRDTVDAEDGRKSVENAWEWRDSQAPSSYVPRNDNLLNVTADVYRRSEDLKEDAMEMEHR